MKEKLVCPVCKKSTLVPWLGFSAGMIYFCKNCGYRGALVGKVRKRKRFLNSKIKT